jgi:putative tricarboxylic transport membrane protein
MFEAMLQGLLLVLVPDKLLMLLIGLTVGTVVANCPGFGATVALAILLPFLVRMDPVSAVAMMMGVFGVINTADSITAVMLGIPGTPGGAATIVEGHSMARKGEAARALAASLTASLIGGVIGAIGLGFSIPILGVLIKQFGSPNS